MVEYLAPTQKIRVRILVGLYGRVAELVYATDLSSVIWRFDSSHAYCSRSKKLEKGGSKKWRDGLEKR